MLNRAVRILVFTVIMVLASTTHAEADDSYSEVGVVVGSSESTVTLEGGYSKLPARDDLTNPSSASTGKADSKSTCSFDGLEINCRSTFGVWSATRQCYVAKSNPQPGPDHPIWNGKTDGAIYECVPPGAAFSAGEGSGYLFWVADGDTDAADLIDPVELAERAVERMDLMAPEVGVTPLDPDAPLLVGMDAWFWIDNDGERSSGPITRSATAGPTTVSATARVLKTVWETGDGTTVTCRNSGTKWTPELGTGPSPTCGHRYKQASTSERHGVYEIRATTHWQVEWSGAGQTGEITFTMTGARPLEVTELQVLQTG